MALKLISSKDQKMEYDPNLLNNCPYQGINKFLERHNEYKILKISYRLF